MTAVAQIDGPEAGLAILDRLHLDHDRYFHSTRTDLLDHAEAQDAYRRTLDLAQTEPEQRLLQDRLTGHPLRREEARPREHLMVGITAPRRPLPARSTVH